MKHGCYISTHNLINGRAHSIQTIKTVASIQDATFSVQLVCPYYPGMDAVEQTTQQQYNLQKKVHITTLRCGIKKYITHIGLICYVIRVFFLLVSLILRKNIDFIYFRDERLFPVAVLAKFFSIPYYYEIHRKEKKRIEKIYRDCLIRYATGVVAITPGLVERYKSLQPNILLSECGYHETLFYQIKRKSHKLFTLGYAGGLSQLHGLDFVAHAIRSMSDVMLQVVGGTKKDIDRLQSINTVNMVFTGIVEYADVASCLRDVDVLLLPQLRLDIGAVSSKMYEYFALGKPIIASNTPPNKVHILHKKNGLLYQIDDEKAFCECVRMLQKDTMLYTQLAHVGPQMAEQFSFSRRGQRIRSFIRAHVL